MNKMEKSTLNSNEIEVLKTMMDTEYLNCINVNADDIEKAIKLGIKEFNELEDIVKEAIENKESFQSLCKRLQGHNETFHEKYPDYNYFDLNYKSLLVTIKEELNENNKSVNFNVMESDVYIYPDNISKVDADEICILDLGEKIDFEKIKNELENEIEEEI